MENLEQRHVSQVIDLLISIGSNRRSIGGVDASAKVRQCRGELDRLAPVVSTAGENDAEPLMSFAAKGGFAASPVLPYANAVAWVRAAAPLSREGIERILKQAEAKLGRRRPAPEVEIDIDLLMFGREIVRERDFERYYCRVPAVVSMIKGEAAALPPWVMALMLPAALT